MKNTALDREIARYVNGGYELRTRTETSAQLVKRKKFSFFWATAWFLLFGVGLLVYLFWYWAKKDRVVYLYVDETGQVRSG